MAFSGWRGGVAAGLAAMALSGCADKERPPSSVEDTHCSYEVGPFGYTLARGEGNCPPLEVAHDPGVPMMGAAPPPEIEPEMGEMVEPEPELMGKVAAPDVVEVMGEAPMQPDVPCESEKPPEPPEIKGQAPAEPPKPIRKMGKVAKPVEAEVFMGDMVAPENE